MKPTIIANWKMNGSREELINFCQNPPGHDRKDISVVLCPPSLYIREAVKCTSDNFHIFAQDCSPYPKGAYTGDISAPMIKDAEASGTLIGHSERREYHGETDELVAQKLGAAITHSITPVVCFGETLEEYEAGHTNSTVHNQLETIVKSCDCQLKGKPILWAYEPRWAIGTGKTPNRQEIATVIQETFNVLNALLGPHNPRILYGGSVKADNASEISNITHVAGALVGGASLDKAHFEKIIAAWKQPKF